MRVLYASHFGELGGAERSLLELMLAVRHHAVEPVLLCPPGRLSHAAAEAGISVAPWSARRVARGERHRALGAIVRAWHDADRAVRRFRPHVVHANTTQARLQLGPVAALRRCAMVWHWRDFDDHRALLCMLARGCGAVIAISRAMHGHAARVLAARTRIELIHNAVADPGEVPDGEAAAVRRALDLPATAPLVVMAGQAVPRKGHEVLLAALAVLAARCPAAHAVLACPAHDATGLAHARQLRARAAGDRRIRIVDGVSPLAPLLAAADVVAVPSLREPFGRVAVEAMLARRPVVASDVDGLREIVRDGHDGLLVAPGQPSRLAAGLAAVLGAPALWRDRGRAARDRALARFSVARLAQAVTAVYRSLDPAGVEPIR